jgi:hypothetical protein
MKIIIGDNLYIEDMPEAIAGIVRRELTRPNPEYVTRERLNKWTGDTEPTLTLARFSGDICRLPRGYYGRLAHLARENATPVDIIDKRLVLPQIDLSFRGELRDYQQRALDGMTRRADGVLVAPCGSGKTAIGCAVISHWRQPSLVLVHTRQLAEQTMGAVKQWLGVSPGLIGDSTFDVRAVTAIHDVKASPNGTKPTVYGDREAKNVYASYKAAEIDAT